MVEKLQGLIEQKKKLENYLENGEYGALGFKLAVNELERVNKEIDYFYNGDV